MDRTTEPTAREAAPADLRLAQVVDDQRRVLELLARGAPLGDVLGELAASVTAVVPDVLCSFTTVDGASRRLDLVTSRGLHLELQRQLHGLPIGHTGWSCAEAVSTGRRAHRVGLDAARFGVTASSSLPVRSTTGEVLGSLDLWWRSRPGDASTHAWFLDLARDLAGIAIERDRLVHQLKDRSFSDPVTGLANRHLFTTILRSSLEATGPSRGGVAVLAVDLDRFKALNSSLGHQAGNEILAEVARRLAASVRPNDLVARFHADEFLVLLTSVRDADGTLQVATRIGAQLREPLLAAGREVFVSPSIGVALHESGATADTLIERALAAMHRAKERGTGGCELFDSAVSEGARRRLDLEQDLWRAVDRQEMTLLYQPIVKLSSGEAVGVEALVRWNHRQLGMVSPADFIPLAEGSGAIVTIGRWVLNEACRQAAAWSALPRLRHLKMSVNISPRQFHQPDFVEEVSSALEASGLHPSRLVLEITEGVVMSDVQTVVDTLTALKALGVRLAVDDFGAGYSSLSYLKRFPLDSLKIDRSFISAVDVGPADLAIVEAVIVLAARLGLRVVAEGVESSAQASQLLELGCGLAQGYLFSRPATAAEVEERLRKPPQPAAVA